MQDSFFIASLSVPLALSQQAIFLLGIGLGFVLLNAIWLIALRSLIQRKTRRMQKELAEQVFHRETAEAANQAKGEFLASMSHEIRTPLNAILAFTDLALKNSLNPELREYIDTVRTSAEWLMHIVSDVLEFSRMEAGRLQLNDATFSLAECLQSALKMVEPEAVGKSVLLRTKIDLQIAPYLRGDATRLRQVIFNLLDNAVKFTTTGSVMLSAVLESKSEDSVLVRISVADTGVGIPPQNQQQIFEPFSPAHQNASGKYGGTGLGLAICRKLVNLMGGVMEFQSQLGAGSTFQFTARFAEAPAPANVDRAPMIPVEIAPDLPSRDSEKAEIADDYLPETTEEQLAPEDFTSFQHTEDLEALERVSLRPSAGISADAAEASLCATSVLVETAESDPEVHSTSSDEAALKHLSILLAASQPPRKPVPMISESRRDPLVNLRPRITRRSGFEYNERPPDESKLI